jgi:membrane fusion protein, multidrug efflux system
MKMLKYITPGLLGLGSILISVQSWAEEPESYPTEVAVHTGSIILATLHRYVSAYGLIEPEPPLKQIPSASSKISAPVMGILAKVYCQEGQVVQKGAILFELDTRAADALVDKARVSVAFAQKNFARKQQLKATDNISTKLYDDAEQMLQTAQKDLANAQTQRALLRITAPLSGTIAAIHFKAGEAINSNTVLADLIDLERLDMAFRIPSQEALWLKLGQMVETTTDDNAQGEVMPLARVSFISPQIDALTDTVLIRATFDTKTALRPGQWVSGRITVEERPGRLAVPIESVVTLNQNSTIAVVDGDRAQQKSIQTGLKDGPLIEISGDGIKEGMTVVTQGAYGLPSETRIRVIPY